MQIIIKSCLRKNNIISWAESWWVEPKKSILAQYVINDNNTVYDLLFPSSFKWKKDAKNEQSSLL